MSPPRGRPEAIVRPAAVGRALTVERIAPSAALRPFVDYHWLVRWDVGAPHTQQVVPQPRVHLVAEDGRLWIHSVSRRAFARRLTGRGHALGAAFHAGGFRPLLGRDLDDLTDDAVPAADVLGRDDADEVARRILGVDDAAEMVDALEGWISALSPQPDPLAAQVTAWVALAEERTDITRVSHLADAAAVSVRTLQRTFAAYVGVGPKWVIQRFRILEATAAAHTGAVTDWARLAHDLGFSDQAHLTRVFADVVGTPPATYQREAGADAG